MKAAVAGNPSTIYYDFLFIRVGQDAPGLRCSKSLHDSAGHYYKVKVNRRIYSHKHHLEICIIEEHP